MSRRSGLLLCGVVLALQEFAACADHVHCREGTYGVKVELFGSTTCVPCAKGRYSDDEDSDSCKECPRGKYAEHWASTWCRSCPKGRASQYIDRHACVEPPPAALRDGFGRHVGNAAALRVQHSGDAEVGTAPDTGLVGQILDDGHHIEQWSTKQKLGSAPFLYPQEEGPDSWANPGNVKASVAACERQCLEVERCAYGTYITDGERKGECWLSAQTALPLASSSPCGVPCISFRKVESASGDVAPTMSAKMLQEEEQSEDEQLHAVQDALEHEGDHDHDSRGDGHTHPHTTRAISKLSISQASLESELAAQKKELVEMRAQQKALEKNLHAKMEALHARTDGLHDHLRNHNDTLKALIGDQKTLMLQLTLMEHKLLTIAPRVGMNYTKLVNAIDHRVRLHLNDAVGDDGLATQFGMDQMNSAAAIALALDHAHLAAVAKAGGFEHFEKAGLVCAAPPVPDHGYMLAYSDSARVVGGHVRFACNFGYKMQGSGVRKCEANLEWSGTVTFCEQFTPSPTPAPTPRQTRTPTPAPTPEKHCGKVPEPANALISGVDLKAPSYAPGAVVFYRCKDGFQLIGSQSVECAPHSHGKWTVPPVCAANVRTCSHLTCTLRLTHDVVPNHPGYHLQIHHHKDEQRGTQHKCVFRGDADNQEVTSDDCICECWDT
eukprot:g1640.t1